MCWCVTTRRYGESKSSKLMADNRRERKENTSLEYKLSDIQYCLGCKSRCTFLETWFTQKKVRNVYLFELQVFCKRNVGFCRGGVCALVECSGKTERKVERSWRPNQTSFAASRTVWSKPLTAFYGQKASFSWVLLSFLFACWPGCRMFLGGKKSGNGLWESHLISHSWQTALQKRRQRRSIRFCVGFQSYFSAS